MRNFRKIFIALFIVQLQLIGNAYSQLSDTIQIDFGTTLTSLASWNNVTSPYAGTSVNLVNSKGNATGFTLSVTDGFSGIYPNGTVANASLKIPSTASLDGFYGNDQVYGGMIEPTGAVKISNLDVSIPYSFTIFGSRAGQTDNREAKYTLTGQTTVVVTLNASSNTANTANVSGLLPASDGTISIKAEKGSNNNNPYGFYYLGVVKMAFNAAVKTLALTSPNGGEQLKSGKQTNITWTSSNISTVDLDYSIDNGTTWNSITTSVPAANSSYNWTIPSASSTNCLVRVKDHTNATVSDVSNAVFSVITVSLTVTSPNGGEQLKTGSQTNITWASVNVTSVAIDYSIDNGTTWNSIATSVPAANSLYNWTIPSPSSSNCLVRVKDNSDATFSDVSNAVFSIYSTSLTVTSPNGNEQLKSGSQTNITWISVNITSIDLDYSIDNGTTWNSIATAVPAANSLYNWTIPSTSSSNCLVRIKDHSNASVSDVSNAVFSIFTASIVVSSPNGGEQLESAKQANITWTFSNVSTLDIDYSTDNGISWNAVATVIPATDNSYNWTIPSTPSTICLVRIKDHSDATVSDVSNAVFGIINPTQQTVSADTIQIDFGSTLTLLTGWNNVITTNAGTSVTLVNSKGNASGLTLNVTDAFSNVNTGGAVANASLKIPSTASGDSFYGNDQVWGGATEPTGAVKITNLDTSIPYSFSIFSSRVGGITDNREAKYTLTGQTSIVVTLNASNNTANTASVNNLLPASDGSITLKAEKGSNNNNSYGFYYLGVVKMTFTGKTVPVIKTLTITSPNGGEQLTPGKQTNIAWTAVNVTSLDIDYSADNGVSWNSVATSVLAANNSYSWTVPSISSASCLVRIKDSSDATVSDVSNAVFSISAVSLLVTSPNGGEQLVAGTQANITWTSANVSLVDINYSIDNGETWNSAGTSLPAANNLFNWTVPSTLSTKGLVRINDHSNIAISDISDAVFSIVTTPVKQAAADTVQIDFGDVLTQITGWNNVTSPYLGTSVNLVNSKGNATTLTLNVTDAFSQINYGGAVANASLNIPSTASGDSFYGNEQSWGGVTEPTGAVTINNLDTSIPYSFSIFSSRDGVTDNRETKYTLIGQSTIVVNLNTSNNTSNTAVVNNLLPASDGSITIKAEKGSNNNNTSGFYYLGVVKMFFNGVIKPLTVTSPNGGEQLEAEKQTNIAWTVTNTTITSVDIDYSADNGLTWNSVATSVPASNNSFSWTIPSKFSTSCLVSVKDHADATTYDVSNAVFTIFDGSLKTISVTSPNGGEVWEIGKQATITWSSTNISSVDLDYSADYGTNWNSIATNVTAANNSYTWTIPATPSTNCLVKVKDHSDATIKDLSNANFSIIVSTGKQYNIVVLGSSSAAGTGADQIDSAWVWRYREYLQQQATNFTVTNLAVSGFTTFDVLPSGNSDHNITKALSFNPDAIIINLPSNDAANGYSVATQLANYDTLINIAARAGVPVWITTPQPRNLWNADKNQILREMVDSIQTRYGDFSINFWDTITDPNGYIATLYDSGDGIHLNNTGHRLLFEQLVKKNIVGYLLNGNPVKTITVTSPNGGEQWIAGSQVNITWTEANVTSLDIDYSPDDGVTWNLVATAVTASNNSYPWTLPSTTSSMGLVRVKDHSNATVFDISNAVFTIFLKSLAVTAPNGGEQLEVGKQTTITWTSANILSVDIDYSLNNGTSWNTVAASVSANSYSWTVPTTNSTNCLIRVKDHADATVTDICDALFTIYTVPVKALTVTSPNGAEQLEVGKQTTITWTSANVLSVDIDYSLNNGTSWNTVAASVSANSYSWTVPATISTNCLLRVKDHADAAVSDVSNAVFTILLKSLAVTAPNGGEQLEVGKQTTITWTSANVVSVDIDYSANNGTSWNTVAASVSANSYSWTVPATTSTNCLVRVKDHTDATIFDISNAVFTIKVTKSLVVTSPNGGEQLEVGSQINIVWTSVNVNSVDIDYSSDNGSSWNTVATAVTASSYNWTVPSVLSTNCLIKVKDHADVSISDINNAVFAIKVTKSLAVTYPNGGEQLEVGTQMNIVWTSSNVNSVDIDYSSDNGSSWNTVVTAVTASSYNWTVPSVLSTNCLVKVKDHVDASVSDVSNAVFTIKVTKSLAVTYPNGGEQLVAGTQLNIVWASRNVTTVDIDYSSNNGANWTTVASSVSASSYNWAVPSVSSTSCLVRVKDHADATIIDASDAIFSITPAQTTVAFSNLSVLDTTINAKKNILIDDSNTLNILIYPNPVIDNLNISSTNGSIINSIAVFNSMGIIVMKQNLNSSNSVIDIRPLAVGNYYLMVRDGDSMFTIKMVKQ